MYSIKEMADLCGLSTRALQHFEQKGLLRPQRLGNGYRAYGEQEVARLQHLLFYRELGLPLQDIKGILDRQDFDSKAALQNHLVQLKEKAARMERLINTLEKTIAHEEGRKP